MNRVELPISTLPAWMRLNNATFCSINVRTLGEKGYALAAEKDVNSENTHDQPILLHVPQDLVLSAIAIEEHAKSDKDFRDLLSTLGGKVFEASMKSGSFWHLIQSTRLDSMLFLLMQVINGNSSAIVGTSNPWTEYVKMLPGLIPVPTLWVEDERDMLVGTSLEVCIFYHFLFWYCIHQFVFYCDVTKNLCSKALKANLHSRLLNPRCQLFWPSSRQSAKKRYHGFRKALSPYQAGAY